MQRLSSTLARRCCTHLHATHAASGTGVALSAVTARSLTTRCTLASSSATAASDLTLAQIHAECAISGSLRDAVIPSSASPQRHVAEGDAKEGVTPIRHLSDGLAPSRDLKFAGRSAVLVGLFTHPRTGGIHVLLTQRSSALRSHGGDVSLPGGRRDETDACDAACALREAWEEVGLPRVDGDHLPRSSGAGARLMTTLKPGVSKNGLLVVPVASEIPAPDFLLDGLRADAAASSAAASSTVAASASSYSFTPVLNSSEVAVLFSVPLSRFLDGGPGYAFKDISWQGSRVRMHEFLVTLPQSEWISSDEEAALMAQQAQSQTQTTTPASGERTFRIWGLTSWMLVAAAMHLFKRKPTFATIAAMPTSKL